MNIQDIPQDILKQMREAIRLTDKYQQMNQVKVELMKRGLYAQAAIEAKKLQKLENQILEQWVKNFEGETKKIKELKHGMSEEDIDHMNVCCNMLIMICDMLETCSSELNQLLQKYHPTYRIETFDKVNALGKEAKNKVRLLDPYNSDTYYTNTYGTYADNLFEMCYNKAKSFIGKLKKREEKLKSKVA